MAGARDKYEGLRKKYGLPEYALLDTLFELDEIPAETDLVLQKVKSAILSKAETYATLLESVIMPDTSLANMYEAHYLEDSDKKKAYQLYKRMMHILRQGALAATGNSDEECADFISHAHSEWSSLKAELHSHISKLLKAWEKETDVEEDLNYFG